MTEKSDRGEALTSLVNKLKINNECQSVTSSSGRKADDHSSPSMTKGGYVKSTRADPAKRQLNPTRKMKSANLGTMEIVNSSYRKPLESCAETRGEDTSRRGRPAKEKNQNSPRRSHAGQTTMKDVPRNQSGEEKWDSGGRSGKNTRRFRQNNDSRRLQAEDNKSHSRKRPNRRNRNHNAPNENEGKESKEPLEEELLTNENLLLLGENKIKQLKKKNKKFPKARYFCLICSLHLNCFEHCQRHVTEYSHIRKKKLGDQDSFLRALPKPNSVQLVALSDAVNEVAETQGISKNEQNQRTEVVARLQSAVAKETPDVLLTLYGSSLTRFGLKTSDINVNLTCTQPDMQLALLLKQVFENMQKNIGAGFSQVTSNFTASTPGFSLVDDATGLTVHVTINCYNAYCCSQLLSIYSDFDPRVRILSVAFRYWAHLCGLDKQGDGYLSAQAFNLMVIYFLQSIDPQLLPIVKLPKIKGDRDHRKNLESFEKKRAKVLQAKALCQNHMTVGELWYELLRFYCLEFEASKYVVCIDSEEPVYRNVAPWNTKVPFAVQDPYMPRKNISRLINNPNVCAYFEDSFRRALYYFGLPHSTSKSSFTSIEDFMKKLQEGKNSFKKHVAETGEAAGHEPVDSNSKSSNTHQSKLHIAEKGSVDTTQVLHNLSACPAKTIGGKPQNESLDTGHALEGSEGHARSDDEGVCSSDTESATDTRCMNEVVSEADAEDSDDDGEGSISSVSTEGSMEDNLEKTRLKQLQDLIASLIICTEYFYKFSKDFLTTAKGPVLVCTYCDKEGHLSYSCPDDKLPPVTHLPPLNPFDSNVLCETLQSLPARLRIYRNDLVERETFLQRLEEFVQSQYKDAKLTLFGSSCNGFGFKNSDMDICLTFSQKKSVEDKPFLIESLARKLKHNKEIFHVQAILTAKVPIVKFKVKHSQIEGDISLYNILAQHNTQLLLQYSQIDPRVQVLGYTIKHFAKVSDIGDAARGSLSSYAYILLMIFYLQQVEPPVLPVLQELYEGQEKPSLMVDNCNAWFCQDLSLIQKLWPDHGRNNMSVAELWLGFLSFYVQNFNLKELVVSVRQRKPLAKLEKLWSGETIAIEDPFDLNHNLGSSLARKMNNFILKTFIKARVIFGSPLEVLKTRKYNSIHDYYFDPAYLCLIRPTNARGCHKCGLLGHVSKNCLSNLKTKNDGKVNSQQKLQPQQCKNLPPRLQTVKGLQAKQEVRQPLDQQQGRFNDYLKHPSNNPMMKTAEKQQNHRIDNIKESQSSHALTTSGNVSSLQHNQPLHNQPLNATSTHPELLKQKEPTKPPQQYPKHDLPTDNPQHYSANLSQQHGAMVFPQTVYVYPKTSSKAEEKRTHAQPREDAASDVSMNDTKHLQAQYRKHPAYGQTSPRHQPFISDQSYNHPGQDSDKKLQPPLSESQKNMQAAANFQVQYQRQPLEFQNQTDNYFTRQEESKPYVSPQKLQKEAAREQNLQLQHKVIQPAESLEESGYVTSGQVGHQNQLGQTDKSGIDANHNPHQDWYSQPQSEHRNDNRTNHLMAQHYPPMFPPNPLALLQMMHYQQWMLQFHNPALAHPPRLPLSPHSNAAYMPPNLSRHPLVTKENITHTFDNRQKSGAESYSSASNTSANLPGSTNLGTPYLGHSTSIQTTESSPTEVVHRQTTQCSPNNTTTGQHPLHQQRHHTNNRNQQPNYRDYIPYSSSHVVSNTPDTHNSRGHVPGSKGHISEIPSKDCIPGSVSKTAHIEGETPDSRGHIPDSRIYTPDSRGHIPDCRGHTPASYSYTPDSRGHTPESRGHTPDSRGHIPDSRGHTPASYSYTPDSRGNTPNSKGYTSDSRGHTPESRGHTPDNRTLTPDARSPTSGSKDHKQGNFKLAPPPGLRMPVPKIVGNYGPPQYPFGFQFPYGYPIPPYPPMFPNMLGGAGSLYSGQDVAHNTSSVGSGLWDGRPPPAGGQQFMSESVKQLFENSSKEQVRATRPDHESSP